MPRFKYSTYRKATTESVLDNPDELQDIIPMKKRSRTMSENSSSGANISSQNVSCISTDKTNDMVMKDAPGEKNELCLVQNSSLPAIQSISQLSRPLRSSSLGRWQTETPMSPTSTQLDNHGETKEQSLPHVNNKQCAQLDSHQTHVIVDSPDNSMKRKSRISNLNEESVTGNTSFNGNMGKRQMRDRSLGQLTKEAADSDIVGRNEMTKSQSPATNSKHMLSNRGRQSKQAVDLACEVEIVECPLNQTPLRRRTQSQHSDDSNDIVTDVENCNSSTKLNLNSPNLSRKSDNPEEKNISRSGRLRQQIVRFGESVSPGEINWRHLELKKQTMPDSVSSPLISPKLRHASQQSQDMNNTVADVENCNSSIKLDLNSPNLSRRSDNPEEKNISRSGRLRQQIVRFGESVSPGEINWRHLELKKQTIPGSVSSPLISPKLTHASQQSQDLHDKKLTSNLHPPRNSPVTRRSGHLSANIQQSPQNSSIQQRSQHSRSGLDEYSQDASPQIVSKITSNLDQPKNSPVPSNSGHPRANSQLSQAYQDDTCGSSKNSQKSSPQVVSRIKIVYRRSPSMIMSASKLSRFAPKYSSLYAPDGKRRQSGEVTESHLENPVQNMPSSENTMKDSSTCQSKTCRDKIRDELMQLRQRLLDEKARLENNRMLISKQSELAMKRNKLRIKNQAKSGEYNRMCYEKLLATKQENSVEYRVSMRKQFLQLQKNLLEVHKELIQACSCPSEKEDVKVKSDDMGLDRTFEHIQNLTEGGCKVQHKNAIVTSGLDSNNGNYSVEENGARAAHEENGARAAHEENGARAAHEENADKSTDEIKDLLVEKAADMKDGSQYPDTSEILLKQLEPVYQRFMKLPLSPYILVINSPLVLDILRTLECGSSYALSGTPEQVFNRISCMFVLEGNESLLTAYLKKVAEYKTGLYAGMMRNNIIAETSTQTNASDLDFQEIVLVETSTNFVPNPVRYPCKRIIRSISENREESDLSSNDATSDDDDYDATSADDDASDDDANDDNDNASSRISSASPLRNVFAKEIGDDSIISEIISESANMHQSDRGITTPIEEKQAAKTAKNETNDEKCKNDKTVNISKTPTPEGNNFSFVTSDGHAENDLIASSTYNQNAASIGIVTHQQNVHNLSVEVSPSKRKVSLMSPTRRSKRLEHFSDKTSENKEVLRNDKENIAVKSYTGEMNSAADKENQVGGLARNTASFSEDDFVISPRRKSRRCQGNSESETICASVSGSQSDESNFGNSKDRPNSKKKKRSAMEIMLQESLPAIQNSLRSRRSLGTEDNIQHCKKESAELVVKQEEHTDYSQTPCAVFSQKCTSESEEEKAKDGHNKENYSPKLMSPLRKSRRLQAQTPDISQLDIVIKIEGNDMSDSYNSGKSATPSSQPEGKVPRQAVKEIPPPVKLRTNGNTFLGSPVRRSPRLETLTNKFHEQATGSHADAVYDIDKIPEGHTEGHVDSADNYDISLAEAEALIEQLQNEWPESPIPDDENLCKMHNEFNQSEQLTETISEKNKCADKSNTLLNFEECSEIQRSVADNVNPTDDVSMSDLTNESASSGSSQESPDSSRSPKVIIKPDSGIIQQSADDVSMSDLTNESASSGSSQESPERSRSPKVKPDSGVIQQSASSLHCLLIEKEV